MQCIRTGRKAFYVSHLGVSMLAPWSINAWPRCIRRLHLGQILLLRMGGLWNLDEPYTSNYCNKIAMQNQRYREQQFFLWFDPTKAYHIYSIVWNSQRSCS